MGRFSLVNKPFTVTYELMNMKIPSHVPTLFPQSNYCFHFCEQNNFD